MRLSKQAFPTIPSPVALPGADLKSRGITVTAVTKVKDTAMLSTCIAPPGTRVVGAAVTTLFTRTPTRSEAAPARAATPRARKSSGGRGEMALESAPAPPRVAAATIPRASSSSSLPRARIKSSHAAATAAALSALTVQDAGTLTSSLLFGAALRSAVEAADSHAASQFAHATLASQRSRRANAGKRPDDSTTGDVFMVLDEEGGGGGDSPGGAGSEDGSGETGDERKVKRLARNRESARQRRQKKRDRADECETEVRTLSAALERLVLHRWGLWREACSFPTTRVGDAPINRGGESRSAAAGSQLLPLEEDEAGVAGRSLSPLSMALAAAGATHGARPSSPDLFSHVQQSDAASHSTGSGSGPTRRSARSGTRSGRAGGGTNALLEPYMSVEHNSLMTGSRAGTVSTAAARAKLLAEAARERDRRVYECVGTASAVREITKPPPLPAATAATRATALINTLRMSLDTTAALSLPCALAVSAASCAMDGPQVQPWARVCIASDAPTSPLSFTARMPTAMSAVSALGGSYVPGLAGKRRMGADEDMTDDPYAHLSSTHAAYVSSAVSPATASMGAPMDAYVSALRDDTSAWSGSSASSHAGGPMTGFGYIQLTREAPPHAPAGRSLDTDKALAVLNVIAPTHTQLAALASLQPLTARHTYEMARVDAFLSTLLAEGGDASEPAGAEASVKQSSYRFGYRPVATAAPPATATVSSPTAAAVPGAAAAPSSCVQYLTFPIADIMCAPLVEIAHAQQLEAFVAWADANENVISQLPYPQYDLAQLAAAAASISASGAKRAPGMSRNGSSGTLARVGSKRSLSGSQREGLRESVSTQSLTGQATGGSSVPDLTQLRISASSHALSSSRTRVAASPVSASPLGYTVRAAAAAAAAGVASHPALSRIRADEGEDSVGLSLSPAHLPVPAPHGRTVPAFALETAMPAAAAHSHMHASFTTQAMMGTSPPTAVSILAQQGPPPPSHAAGGIRIHLPADVDAQTAAASLMQAAAALLSRSQPPPASSGLQ